MGLRMNKAEIDMNQGMFACRGCLRPARCATAGTSRAPRPLATAAAAPASLAQTSTMLLGFTASWGLQPAGRADGMWVRGPATHAPAADPACGGAPCAQHVLLCAVEMLQSQAWRTSCGQTCPELTGGKRMPTPAALVNARTRAIEAQASLGKPYVVSCMPEQAYFHKESAWFTQGCPALRSARRCNFTGTWSHYKDPVGHQVGHKS
jgi:hypothetical protein